jgi:hypothetical protein
MDFIDRIRELSVRIPKQLDHIQTEEATKNALILPFIAALGYDVFDPTEVVPEFTCDVGTKKGEKVDYAIFRDGKPIILIECKGRSSALDVNHAGQLFRYFHVTEARFAILTNGVAYRFFTDLDAPNKMDSKPFLEIDMLNVEDRLVEELKKFSKSAFDVGNILNTATELRYTREIKQLLADQLQNPSPEFMKFFVSQVYGGKFTQAVREQFEQITRRAFRQFINDQITSALKTALGHDVTIAQEEQAPAQVGEQPAQATPEDPQKVVTTVEEAEGFMIVRAILREVVDVKRVSMRDAQSYCAILLDNNNRRPICRLHLNSPTKKYIELFNETKQGEKIPLKELDDIYQHADRLKAIASYYASPKGAVESQ